MNEQHKYQVALSFAGEQRNYVEKVAQCLKKRRIDVFYDEFQIIQLWGKNGTEELNRVFEQESLYVVIFISKAYVENMWTRHELRSALSRMINEEREYILPVRFDDTTVTGLPKDLIYICVDMKTPAEIAVKIAEKLGIRPFESKASDVPPPRETSYNGEVVFDYSSHNGCYVIGCGDLVFETKWTKASDSRIHLYNDPASINGVALARECALISQVLNASSLDYTSRTLIVARGEVAVLRNTNGFYAAIHVCNIKDDSRGADKDELFFLYAIQPNGSDNFEEFVDVKPVVG